MAENKTVIKKTTKKTLNKKSINREILSISKKFKYLKYITAIIAVLFLLSMISFRRDELTYENFQYLLRFMDINSTTYSYTPGYRKIVYNADTEISFSMFKGDFVIAGTSKLNIYNLSGNNILNEYVYINNPVIKSSEKYLLIYDLGGYNYSVYNSFSKLYGETTAYPITSAVMSDSGIYAFVTQTEQYRSAVYVYDKNFKYVGRMLLNNFVMDIDIKEDGSEILISSIFNNDGDFYTEIKTWNPYMAKETNVFQINDIIPISVKYNNLGGYNILCDNRLLFYNSDSQLINTYVYKNDIPYKGFLGEEYSYLIFSENLIGDNYNLIVFDKNSEKINEISFNGKAVKTLPYENYLFILTNDKIIRINILTGEIISYIVEKNAIDIVLMNDNTIMLCYQGKAVTVNIESAFSNNKNDNK